MYKQFVDSIHTVCIEGHFKCLICESNKTGATSYILCTCVCSVLVLYTMPGQVGHSTPYTKKTALPQRSKIGLSVTFLL